MRVLVFERQDHFRAADLRAAMPSLDVREARDREAALAQCADVDVIVALAHEVFDELLQRATSLKWIVALSTGVDHLWTLPSLRPQVRVTNGRGIHGPQMAELAFLFMIGLSRDARRMGGDQRAHVWERRAQPVIFGKTLVVVGVGLIAEELGVRAQAFGMRVLGVSDARQEARGFDALLPRARLHEAAAEADFLVVLAPLEASTFRMIDAGVFAAMKRSAFLINLARGDVVDEAALIEALDARTIAGAGLDVFSREPLPDDSPLWDMPHVMITPRVGGMSDVYAAQVLPLVAHNLRMIEDGRLDAMRNVVR